MSMFNDIEFWIKKQSANISRKRNRDHRIREAIQVGSLVFLWIWARQRMARARQENDTDV